MTRHLWYASASVDGQDRTQSDKGIKMTGSNAIRWTWLGPVLASALVLLLGALWRGSEHQTLDLLKKFDRLDQEHANDHTALKVLETKTDSIATTLIEVKDALKGLDGKLDDRWDALNREGVIGNRSQHVGRRQFDK